VETGSPSQLYSEGPEISSSEPGGRPVDPCGYRATFDGNPVAALIAPLTLRALIKGKPPAKPKGRFNK
jgi:hypothetical protein